jgi:hypothetical protein
VASVYNYGYVPYPDEYEIYYQKRLTANNEPNSSGQSPLTDKEFKDALIDDFAKFGTHNIKLNEKKLGRVSKAKILLSLCLFANFLLLLSLATFTQSTNDKIQKIKIVDTAQINLLNKNTVFNIVNDTTKCLRQKCKNNGSRNSRTKPK